MRLLFVFFIAFSATLVWQTSVLAERSPEPRARALTSDTAAIEAENRSAGRVPLSEGDCD